MCFKRFAIMRFQTKYAQNTQNADYQLLLFYLKFG